MLTHKKQIYIRFCAVFYFEVSQAFRFHISIIRNKFAIENINFFCNLFSSCFIFALKATLNSVALVTVFAASIYINSGYCHLCNQFIFYYLFNFNCWPCLSLEHKPLSVNNCLIFYRLGVFANLCKKYNI